MHSRRSSWIRSSVVVAVAALAACGASSAGATGGACANASECSGGVCLRSTDFPGGYCTQSCDPAGGSGCSEGTVCIDDASGAPAGVRAVCYRTCTSDADCQAGLSCLEKSSKKVCRGGK